MAWSERQRALLRGMGLRLWGPAAAGAEPALADPAAGDEAVGDGAAVAAATLTDSALPAAALQPVPHRDSAAPAHGGRADAAVPPPGPAARPPLAADPVAARAGASGRAQGAAAPSPVAAAAPVLVADLPQDLTALAERVAGCSACGLCASRRQTVFGVGHPQARVMVVGEAPGEQEDREGEPFVGAAGQLLDRMLQAVGLGRGDGPPEQQVYIANTLKCRPPGNRNPSPEELAHCVPYLRQQVALVRPQLILAMGRFAVQALLDSDEPLGRLRGRVHHWQGVPVVVTYHPAYLLRQPAEKAKSWADLCLAASLLEREEVR